MRLRGEWGVTGPVPSDRLSEALHDAGLHHRLIELDAHTRTAAAAADGLGVDLSRIVKSLVCLVDGSPVVALVPGDRELSLTLLAAAAGGREAVLAPRSLVKEITGYPAGGVAPLGHPRPLPMPADFGLRDAGTVYCGGGTASRMVELAMNDLARVTGLQWTDLTRTRT